MNHLKALVTRPMACLTLPRTGGDTGAAPRVQPSAIDPDELVMLTEHLRNLLQVVTECAGAMHANARSGLPVEDEFRDLAAAGESSDRILDRLSHLDDAASGARRPVDVNLNVFECTEMIGRLLGNRIRLHTRLAPGLEPVLASRVEIERILLNLAVSGREGMPDGGTLTIDTASVVEVPAGLRPPHVRARAYVRLTVADTSPGLSSGTRLLVLGRTPLRNQRTADVGLASVAHTVRSLDGTLRIESDDGQGTRVIIDLPCLETAAPAAAG